jgi:transcription initiation factor TFIID subunit 13
MRPRPPGPYFASNDMLNILYAYGDTPPSLPETVRLLDEITVDFIIELCYEADAHAAHANRVKIKADDFQFAMRHSGRMLGRVQDMFMRSKEIGEARKILDAPEGNLKTVADQLGETGKSRRGRRRKGQDADVTVVEEDADAIAVSGDIDASSDKVGSERSGKVKSEGRSISGRKRGASSAGLV